MKIVAFSDSHNKHAQLTIPDGDVLLCAGDITMSHHGDAAEDQVKDFFNWFLSHPHKHKVMIAGNHDFWFERGQLDIPKDIHYLHDSAVELDGKVFWGSPYTPEFCNWAFNVPRGQLYEHWDLIPTEGVDVLITHGPPEGANSRIPWSGEEVGDWELTNALKRARPSLAFCGHLHFGAGSYQLYDTQVNNVSVVDETYEVVRPAQVFELPVGKVNT